MDDEISLMLLLGDGEINSVTIILIIIVNIVVIVGVIINLFAEWLKEKMNDKR